MIVGTFGATTAWVGKSVMYDDGRFTLEGFGEVSAQAVADYDRQGHLVWAYDGLREWVYLLAGQPALTPQVPPAETAPSAATAAMPVVAPVAAPAAPATAPAPVPPQVTATAPATAPVAAPSPSPRHSGGRIGWVIAGVALVVVLLVGLVMAGGRLRDGLGIALTLLAVGLLVVLVVAAIRPGAAGRWFAGLSGRTLLIACGALAAGCFVLAAFLWWMPHYQVIAPSDRRIALDDTPDLKVVVVNRGLLGGTFAGAYSVDGVEQDRVDIPLGAGEGREVTLSLPGDAERGDVLISLGGAGIGARAVAPPAFTVAPLQLDPSVAKLGQNVTLQTTVQNTGDIEGTFDGVLTADGNELITQPVDVSAGATKAVSYTFAADKAGEYRLQLGDTGARFVIVTPVRLSNGYMIKRGASGGRAHMTVRNKTGEDAMVVLTRSGNTHRPVIAVYIRKGARAKIGGIPDGAYVLWACYGTDWNWHMRGFYETIEHKRWLTALKFDTTASTRSWTSHWSDSSYYYSQQHSQTTTHWTNWKITIAAGGSKYSKIVTKAAFPQL